MRVYVGVFLFFFVFLMCDCQRGCVCVSVRCLIAERTSPEAAEPGVQKRQNSLSVADPGEDPAVPQPRRVPPEQCLS